MASAPQDYPIYMKLGAYGDDLRQKILKANSYLHDRGFTDEERLWLIAIGKHNMPNWSSNAWYVDRVRASKDTFFIQ